MATALDHNTLEPATFTGDAPRILIVCAPYYAKVADMLVNGAESECSASAAQVERIDVPGALEIPPAIQMAARMGNFEGFVALGCVIRGETTHYETVCNDSSSGLMELGLRGIPIGNGILTVENMDQALVRADPDQQNKGGGAARAALHLVALNRKLAAKGKGIGFRPRSEDILIAGRPDGPEIA
ncbi:MAG: 6,7-dimethyl-8-ribityllumazine synthase [Pseudomonadota bacterium]